MNEKKQKIIDVLNSNKGDKMQAWDLSICISNTDFLQNSIDYLQNYKNKKIKKGCFDEILFLQAIKNFIDTVLTNPTFDRWYSYNKNNVSVATRFLAAQEIADRMD